MLNKIDEEMLDGGYLLEWAYDDDVESPRTMPQLGHFYCWGRNFISPDDCDYSEPEEWMASKLMENLSQEEMEQAVRDGLIPSLRLTVGEDGEEVLEAWYKSLVTGKEGWDEVTDYNEWRDAEEIAKAIAECSEAPKLLARHGVLLPVYRFEHSGVSYSTAPFNDPWDSGQVGFIWVSDKELDEMGLCNRPEDEIRKMLSDEVEEYSAWANGECYAVMLSKDDAVIDSLGGLIGDDNLECWLEGMRRLAANYRAKAATKTESEDAIVNDKRREELAEELAEELTEKLALAEGLAEELAEELATIKQEAVTNGKLVKSLTQVMDLFRTALEDGLYRNKKGCELLEVISHNTDNTVITIARYQNYLERRFYEITQEIEREKSRTPESVSPEHEGIID